MIRKTLGNGNEESKISDSINLQIGLFEIVSLNCIK